MGRLEEARRVFARVTELMNDVGLISEDYETKAKLLLGNVPQAFTHVGIVNSARNLAKGFAELRQPHTG
jgi:GH15 family glucan-1,4-alpha-glucosidase